MYEVRCTTVAGGACLCTRYEVRFGEFGGYAASLAASGAYVRLKLVVMLHQVNGNETLLLVYCINNPMLTVDPA